VTRPTRTLFALVATLPLVLAAPASAHPNLPVDPAGPLDLTYTATDNVELLGRFPEHVGTAGARLVDDRFYLTDPRGVYVYDVSDPADPTRLGALALPQSGTFAALAQEEPDTDGNILLVDAYDPMSGSTSGGMKVVDVSDPTNMAVIGSAPVGDHTWTCVSTPDNGCAYAYGRTGYIVDLTDPTQPEVLDTSWREHTGVSEGFTNTPYAHDLTEIRTGRVISAGAHNTLMDTTDPAAPRLLHDHVVDFHTFGYHGIDWANEGEDALMVAGTEIAPEGATNLAGSDCQGEGSWITTYDTSSVRKADERAGEATGLWRRAEFEPLDHFHVEDRGIFLDGNAPAHALYCAHWVDLAPDWEDGGRLAVSYYDWGTRFVDVDGDGQMAEIGWFLPAEGYSGSPRWITEDIVYVMDYRRGLEILRIGDEPATGTTTGVVDPVADGSTLSEPSFGGLASVPGSASGLALAVGLALGALGLARRRREGVADEVS
jgi:hypothetical protein